MADKKNQQNWFRRHWIISIFLGLILLGMIGSLFGGDSDSTGNVVNEQTGNEETVVLNSQEEKKQGYVIENLVDILPTREEIPTEFTIDERDKANLENVEGAIDGEFLSISKLTSTYGIIVVDMRIYEFSSQNSVRKYYDERIDFVEELGGYSEIKLSTESNCFGYKESYGFDAEFATAICYNENIFFWVEGTSSGTIRSPENDMKGMVSIIDKKLN